LRSLLAFIGSEGTPDWQGALNEQSFYAASRFLRENGQL
jgi:hypothetical protein